jgi:hypothetical protein
MSKVDAQRALSIYKTFSKQTSEVVEFLGVARRYEHATRLEIPTLKHAPTSLTSSLEEYLNDPDFEINRRQYLAQQEAKRGGKPNSNGASRSFEQKKSTTIQAAAPSSSFPEPKTAAVAPAKQQPKGPAPDLIDFFDSIEQNQQSMVPQPQLPTSNFQSGPQYHYQQPVFTAQNGLQQFQTQPQQQMNGLGNSTHPFGQQLQQPQQQQLQMQPDFTGAGFGGYSQQSTVQPPAQSFATPYTSIPENQTPSFLSQSPPITSPIPDFSFASPTQNISFPPHPPIQSQSTNPFRQSMMPPTASQPSPLSSLNRQSTNPFARNLTTQTAGPVQNTSFNTMAMQSPMSMPSSTASTFFSTPLQSPQQQQAPQSPPAAQPLQPMRTGTNPFARSTPPAQPQTTTLAPLLPNPTGTTNPFRQSVFVNQQSGQGWQATQGTMGGLENLETIPVFPRPGGISQQQQQPWPQ